MFVFIIFSIFLGKKMSHFIEKESICTLQIEEKNATLLGHIIRLRANQSSLSSQIPRAGQRNNDYQF